MAICKKSAYWKVDGTPICTPTSVKISYDNIVSSDSGRTESGRMNITWIRPSVRTVELTYDRITGAEVAFLHGLMQGKEFTFTYFDGEFKSMSAYAGRDSYTQSNLQAYADEGGLYTGYSITVIEM